ncbi:hypothetical protein EBR03_01145 [bacterium]|nr:hypothetical protein [bacterium]
MPIVAVIVLTARGSFKVNELKIYGEVPEFQLTDRSGKSITLDSLKGKVWVGNFIFTACTSQCPLITMEAKKISKALLFKDRFQMVYSRIYLLASNYLLWQAPLQCISY